MSMKVIDLMSKLAKCPPDAIVQVRIGCEIAFGEHRSDGLYWTDITMVSVKLGTSDIVRIDGD